MSGAMVLDVACSRVEIDPRRSAVLTPHRPPPFRAAGFEREFNLLTLFADVFRDPDGAGVTALTQSAPAAYRQPGAVQVRSLADGRPLEAVWPVRPRVRQPEEVRIVCPPGENSLILGFGEQVEIVPVQPNLSRLFAGRRVLVTVSKDNRLEWIADWARFHQVHHGVDAVLFYDSRSERYAPEDVAATLARVPGLAVVAVIPLPTSFGTTRYRLDWPRNDSRPGKPIALVHAQFRLLSQAALVFQIDIDELVVARTQESVDDLLRNTDAAWLRILSQDVVASREAGTLHLRAGDCWHTTGDAKASRREKYAVVPGRCPGAARWRVHRVEDAPVHEVDPSILRIAHFLPLTTGWDGREGRLAPNVPARSGTRDDPVLRQALEEAFDGLDPQPSIWTPATSGDPDLLRAEAQRLAAAGEAGAALRVLQEAIRRDPWHPAQAELRRELLRTLAGHVDKG